MRRFMAGLVALVATTMTADAGVIFHNNLASFSAATTGVQTITFNGLAPAGGFTSYGIGAPGLTQLGVTFTSPNTTLFTIDPAFSPSFYNWGSGTVLGTFFGNPSTINIALPAGTTALGADIMTILDYAGSVTLTLATGETITIPSLNYPNRAFLGVTSTTPIVSLRYSTPAGGQLLDNVRFGQAIIPEPLSIVVFGGVLAAGGLAVRRRMKAIA